MTELPKPRPPAIHTHFSKPEDQNATDSHTSSSSVNKTKIIDKKRAMTSKWQWPSFLAWIPANWLWLKIRLALRCAIAAWVSSVLFIIPTVQVWIGQASFLLLIAAFLSPPVDPFLAVVEREVLISLFVAATWAFACLGMFLANLARTNTDILVPIQTALFSNGQYVEAAPSAILAIFIFLGTAILLYIRVHQGPGPYLFATLFSCICLITNLTTAALVPYPYYVLGRSIFIPLVFHSLISILASILLFPESLSNNFTTRVAAVFAPLQKATSIHLTLLRTKPGGDCVEEFREHINALSGVVAQSEAALGPLAQAARLLPSEVVYSRYSPRDWRPLQDLARRVAVRSNGMMIYFTLIDPTRERFPVTPATTRPGTPAGTAPSTPVEKHSEPPHHHHLSNLLHRAHLHNSSRHHHRASSSYGHRHTSHAPVGVFESQRYLDLEAHVWHDPRTESHTTQTHNLLQESCTPLLEQCQSATGCLQSWFAGAASRDGASWKLAKAILSSALFSTAAKTERREKAKQFQWEERVAEIRNVRQKLEEELALFRRVARLNVVKLYTDALDPLDSPSADDSYLWSYDYNQLPSHRYLFNCYVYQYHLMRFADMLGELLDHVIRLETRPERRHRRVWTPKLHSLASIALFLQWIKGVWTYSDNVGRSASSGYEGEEGEEEDPDRVQHVDRDRSRDVELDELSGETRVGNGVVRDEEDDMYGVGLPYPKWRDPDALPPSNVWELMGRWMYKRVVGLTGGNALYAVKAGVLTTLMCIPFFIRGSAQFAYDNRFLWGIVMAQLTSARFRGDTTFGFLTRILSTFLGGAVGLCMWYICAPTTGHHASPYALGAIFAVCFPFFFYIRLYIPGPPMRILIFFVTAVLVIGYSYQDQYQALPSSPGVGWSVAWRRFLLVACGVFAAFIFSFFPPAFTLRRYQRTALATTCAELGVIYCAVLSLPYASPSGHGGDNKNDTSHDDPRTWTLGHSEETHAIVARLIAIRGKLGRLKAGKVNVKYEISLRGKWPEERYHTLFDLQMQISYSLSHLLSVIEHLEPAWTRALLSRTRFIDPNFQGDVLAVISMISTSLRTGSPLPQITPCPLVDRFMLKYHGLNVIHKEAEEDYGLPRTLTKETLENEQYLMFCVGVSTAFGIVGRLDRLMVAAKEIVGEQYHIQGLGFGGFGSGIARREGVPLGSRTSTRI
ncbi:hypothetical protein GGU10DRAFT_293088 [Lentinula aff. detonsa]|uniref:ER transporter 6TM N-terminal domain-containing protein n=1 Tax=Lentinula aff. detonsa TaxID=2804958 RepID=A0AA38K9W0_9AGAR|nr:hypothetical protein GGU10DRAFT_293088 [Lentinula aff. detonsa]